MEELLDVEKCVSTKNIASFNVMYWVGQEKLPSFYDLARTFVNYFVC